MFKKIIIIRLSLKVKQVVITQHNTNIWFQGQFIFLHTILYEIHLFGETDFLPDEAATRAQDTQRLQIFTPIKFSLCILLLRQVFYHFLDILGLKRNLNFSHNASPLMRHRRRHFRNKTPNSTEILGCYHVSSFSQTYPNTRGSYLRILYIFLHINSFHISFFLLS